MAAQHIIPLARLTCINPGTSWSSTLSVIMLRLAASY
ncbi:hypothetical protein EPIR_0385 [Erwinia piriflorinigrans CFBP 5888]|uniref:Uncharacterized protein n=1 Tax=Erwinia piriflorinigrans CFBP 5888 TaxID=1161919 RepID=V5Z374_9GAMM|nr:hypothetical protein EPIR_0385 [Erwinia piriflorinigrans CFBP 5888]